jgi:hypothetical protein
VDVKLVRPRVVAAYAAVTASVPLMVASASFWQPVERVQPPPVAEVEALSPTARTSDTEAVRALAGMWWWKSLPGLDGSDIGFYYFHGNGQGLYRYGKVGIANTHSFDYDVVGDTLVIEFRKTGVRHELPFEVESDGDIDWLTLGYDPETQTSGARYFRDQPGPIAPHVDPAADASSDLGQPPAGHMWIDLQRYATGGMGFHMYQFRPAGIDGRGVGWFHRGDFDDWSTEAFTYRISGEEISMHFTVADRHEVSAFGVEDTEPRTLRLATDPNDYWHPHAYVDMGVSFGSLPPSAWALSVDVYSRTE